MSGLGGKKHKGRFYSIAPPRWWALIGYKTGFGVGMGKKIEGIAEEVLSWLAETAIKRMGGEGG